MNVIYPDYPGIDGAEEARFVLASLAHLGHVLHQPFELEGAEQGRNGKATRGPEVVLVIVRHFGQNLLDDRVRSHVAPH